MVYHGWSSYTMVLAETGPENYEKVGDKFTNLEPWFLGV